MLLMYTKY